MPVTCGRTSATLKAVVRPGSWSMMATARGFSVITLTSGGGGGPPASLPQADNNRAAARIVMARIFARRVPAELLAFGIACSIRQHATQEVAELVEFFFLETIEVNVHALDHDGPDLVGDLLALGREMQVHHAAVVGAALAPEQVLFLQAVEHARHGREAHL